MTPDPFRQLVRAEGARLYRDLPWRNTRDPYGIWLSEVMLQQTQVARVLERWSQWLERFPDVQALAAAPTADVLAAWQGMGYNRRALALKAAAEEIVRTWDGAFPHETRELCALPGIGPATAQGIRSFAFNLPGVYLETNVRTVMLHQFFPEMDAVPDRELIPLVEATCPAAPAGEEALLRSADGPEGAAAGSAAREGASGVVAGTAGKGVDVVACAAQTDAEDASAAASPYAEPMDAQDTPRAWYYAMLDYGAYLKKTIPNPSRRSKSYARQSKFEGSRRQKRAELVRMLLAAGAVGCTGAALHEQLSAVETAAGREPVAGELVQEILADLEREGFCTSEGDTSGAAWRIA